MTAYQSGKNPFASSEADDEFSFGGAKTRNYKDPSSSREGGGGGFESFSSRGSRDDELFAGSSSSFGEPMSRYEQLQQQKQQSMNRQLDSTNRCLASIYDSEQIGITTAEELMAQGEQLDNVERKLDKILVDTKTSQRHLNGIKSIFGGLRNWWTGDGKKEEAPPSHPAKKQSDALQKAMSVDRDPDSHPALRLRSGNVKGFYDDDVVEFNPNDASGFGSQKTSSSAWSGPETAGGGLSSINSSGGGGGRSAEWNAYEESLNKNLDIMSGGMARLKMLATGLGEEIDSQNEQIENRIMPKADKADIKIRDQNRQMRKILGK